MRIAYVIPAYPPLGSQPFVVNEMIEVQEAGHELVVLPLYRAPDDPVQHGTFARLRPFHVLRTALVDPRSLLLAGWMALRHPVRVARVLGGLHRAAGSNLWAQARLLAVAPKALAAAARLRRLGVRHLHAHFASQTADCAAIASAVSGLSFSFTGHAYDIYSTNPRVRNETLAWKLRHAARVFAVSNFGRDLLRQSLPPGERERVQTAYVGIPTELFRAEPPAPEGDRLVLLCVARLQEKKGIDTLLDACAVLRDRGVPFELRLFGDGPLREALVAQVGRLRLEGHVLLGGSVPQEEIARQLVACHCFVMPCRRDRSGDMDGIPTVFMEALATARPVVSCAVSGVPELVRDGETGLIVPPDDPVALADAVTRLAADPALRARLGQQGRALVERQHDQRRNARQVVAVLAGADATPPAPEPVAAARNRA